MSKNDPPIGWLLGAGPRPVPIYKGDVMTFGRDQQNSFFVEDALASRQHAALEAGIDGRVMVKDMGSRNGTWLNNQNLIELGPTQMRSGDSVRIGGKVYYFVGNSANVEPRKFSTQASQQFSSQETVSQGLYFKDGKVVEEPGPSGSGVGRAATSASRSATLVTAEYPSLEAVEREKEIEQSALSGNLKDQSLPQIVQFIHTNAMTGELVVDGKRLKGSLCFDRGRLFFAEAGSLTGPFAVYSCAREQQGVFRFVKMAQAPVRPPNVAEPTQQVILESCRRMDEL